MKKAADPLSGAGSEEEAAAGEGGAGGEVVVGRLVDSSQADDRRMIRLVRERPLLYARTNMPVASYYAQVKQLWQEVADEMSWTVADVRRKWSHIRNSYSRHLRNELHGMRTGKGRAVSRWYLADELHFLREHMATDTRASPYSYGNSLVKMEPVQGLGHEGIELKPFMNSPWLTLAAAQPTLDPPPQQHGAGEDSCHSQAFSADENSSYFQFFRGIYPEYGELTSRRRRQFKRQCLTLLHGLLDAQERAGEGELGEEVGGAVSLCHSQYEEEDERKPHHDRLNHILSSSD